MKLIATLVMFLTSINLLAGAVDKAKVKAAAEEYAKIGSSIMPSVKDGSATDALLSDKIDGMVKQAQIVMKEYANKYPESKKLVDYLISKSGDLKKASFESLEKDYHDAGKLTKDVVGIDLKDEDNEKFLDPCHIMIHPLMVLAAAREKKTKEGLAELNEGLEQMKTSLAELSK